MVVKRRRRLSHTRAHADNPFRQVAVCFLKHFLYSSGVLTAYYSRAICKVAARTGRAAPRPINGPLTAE